MPGLRPYVLVLVPQWRPNQSGLLVRKVTNREPPGLSDTTYLSFPGQDGKFQPHHIRQR